MDELMVALKESVKLQSHYATLLNMHDAGKRITFQSPEEWINRLREVGVLPSNKSLERAGGGPGSSDGE